MDVFRTEGTPAYQSPSPLLSGLLNSFDKGIRGFYRGLAASYLGNHTVQAHVSVLWESFLLLDFLDLIFFKKGIAETSIQFVMYERMKKYQEDNSPSEASAGTLKLPCASWWTRQSPLVYTSVHC